MASDTFQALADMLKPMNTTRDVAKCGISESTLAYWRSQGIGPKFVKIGRHVLYPREEVLDYMRANLRQRADEKPNERNTK